MHVHMCKYVGLIRGVEKSCQEIVSDCGCLIWNIHLTLSPQISNLLSINLRPFRTGSIRLFLETRSLISTQSSIPPPFGATSHRAGSSLSPSPALFFVQFSLWASSSLRLASGVSHVLFHCWLLLFSSITTQAVVRDRLFFWRPFWEGLLLVWATFGVGSPPSACFPSRPIYSFRALFCSSR